MSWLLARQVSGQFEPIAAPGLGPIEGIVDPFVEGFRRVVAEWQEVADAEAAGQWQLLYLRLYVQRLRGQRGAKALGQRDGLLLDRKWTGDSSALEGIHDVLVNA